MRALVTGGAGFIGSHIIHRLLRDGYAVVVYDNFTSGKRENLAGIERHVEIVEADVRDAPRLDHAMAGCDVIFHEAAIVSLRYSVEHPQESHDVNIQGTLNVLTVREPPQASGAWCSPRRPPSTAKTRSCPSASRCARRPCRPTAWRSSPGEHYLATWSKTLRHGDRRAPLLQRLRSAAGPELRLLGGDQRLRSTRAGSTPITIFGDGEQTRDFVYVDNVVDANVLAATRGRRRGQGLQRRLRRQDDAERAPPDGRSSLRQGAHALLRSSARGRYPRLLRRHFARARRAPVRPEGRSASRACGASSRACADSPPSPGRADPAGGVAHRRARRALRLREARDACPRHRIAAWGRRGAVVVPQAGDAATAGRVAQFSRRRVFAVVVAIATHAHAAELVAGEASRRAPRALRAGRQAHVGSGVAHLVRSAVGGASALDAEVRRGVAIGRRQGAVIVERALHARAARDVAVQGGERAILVGEASARRRRLARGVGDVEDVLSIAASDRRRGEHGTGCAGQGWLERIACASAFAKPFG